MGWSSVESGVGIGRGGKTGSENSTDWLCVRVGGVIRWQCGSVLRSSRAGLSKLERS